MKSQEIRFIRRGAPVTLRDVPPDRTLLDLLRDDLACTGTKEGCGEGDCGACTVVLGEATPDGLRYRAVNSCIRLAHSIDGQALWTVEDLASADGSLHPAQEALVQCHGSQCGFCTPGFVMSLFAMYQNHVCQGRAISRSQASEDLSGNLCRCTGYRPILDAAQQMQTLPAVRVDEAALMRQLQGLAADPPSAGDDAAYLAPRSLQGLLALRARHPQAQLVAGCTDVGLWVTKLHRQFPQVLDLTRVEELRRIERYPHHLAIGAAVHLAEAFAALEADRPQLHAFAARFAGLPVRNAGTLGGNVANGSPIGDSMPLLIALGAHVVLMRQGGHREIPLEALYTGYRQNVMAPDELLAWIKVPLPVRDDVAGTEFLRVYKISKRFDDDISAVCLAVRLQLSHRRVVTASVGVGGVAATPVRARRTEAALCGQPWSAETARAAAEVLRTEFQPISDMRASAGYRTEVLGNLLQRLWLESQGVASINLESWTALEEVA
jgi:xanthine dehydrogenase small subunit